MDKRRKGSHGQNGKEPDKPAPRSKTAKPSPFDKFARWEDEEPLDFIVSPKAEVKTEPEVQPERQPEVQPERQREVPPERQPEEKPASKAEALNIDPALGEKKLLFNTLVAKKESTTSKGSNEETAKTDRSENFQWLKIIGQGTFGVVYKAEELGTKKVVAIKKVYQDPKYSNREFKIVMELDHPNCIKVHNYFFSKKEGAADEVYLNLVMDYIPETLYKILKFYAKKSFPFPNTLGKIYAYQMFRALNYIHALSICHRDIKPQNILIDIKDHRLAICDFGSAKKLRSGESSVAYICSRYYRAPELILGEDRYGTAVDVWSIGCVIAETFLGEPLFCGKDSKDQFLKIMQILGTPSKRDIDAMVTDIVVNVPQLKGSGLPKRLAHCDRDLADLLSRVLRYDPAARIRPLEALAHPYFNDLRSQKLTINGRVIIDLFDFSAVEVAGQEELAARLVPQWYKTK